MTTDSLPLSFKLPFDVPEGWIARSMGNVSNKQRAHYEFVVSTFDFEAFYWGKVKVVLCDNALSRGGEELPNNFSIWWLFDPSILSARDREIGDFLYKGLHELRARAVRDNPAMEYSLPPAPEKGDYVPDSGPFWAYFKSMRYLYDK